MNVELLLKVKQAILDEPMSLDMGNFYPFAGECGTACCIAGHACLIAGVARSESGEWRGAEVLNLELPQIGGGGRAHLRDSGRLFFVSAWPDPFRSEFLELCGDDETNRSSWTPRKGCEKEAAEVCARRIDHFIATEGRE